MSTTTKSTTHRKAHGRSRAAGGAVAIATMIAVGLLVPDGALAAGRSGGDWTSIFNSLGDTGKTIGTVVGGLLLMGMMFWAWAERSVKAIGVTILMAVMASMAVSGQLWSTSTNTGNSLAGQSAGQR